MGRGCVPAASGEGGGGATPPLPASWPHRCLLLVPEEGAGRANGPGGGGRRRGQKQARESKGGDRFATGRRPGFLGPRALRSQGR